MELDEKQKAMLAEDLMAYIKEKHGQGEYVGFVIGYEKALERMNSVESLVTGDCDTCIYKDLDHMKEPCISCLIYQDKANSNYNPRK
jgi:hypothetical protein